MSEHHSDPAEIKLQPPATPVEQLASALEKHDHATVALANVYYIDTIYDEAARRQGTSRLYTELHAARDGIVIAPGVENNERHYATVGGNHSMFDGQRPVYPLTPVQHLEQQLAQTLALTTESLVGKGTLLLNQAGTYELTIGDVRSGSEDNFNWLADLAARASDYPNMSFVYKPLLTNVEQPLTGELPLDTVADIYPKHVALAQEQPGVRSGIVTGVHEEVVLPSVARVRNTQLRRSARLLLSAVEGKIGHHEPVYAAADLKRPGLFTVKAGDVEQELSVHYTVDIRNDLANALILYNNAPQDVPAFAELRKLIHTAVHNYLAYDVSDPAKRKVREVFENVDSSDIDR